MASHRIVQMSWRIPKSPGKGLRYAFICSVEAVGDVPCGAMRLRGGGKKAFASMPGFRNRKGKGKHKRIKVPQRIHGMMRPHEAKRRQLRRDIIKDRTRALLGLNETDKLDWSEDSEEPSEKPIKMLRECRMDERTYGV